MTRGWFAATLRCCLLLAAWQGPIPWCHYHGTLADGPTASLAHLVKHLQSYHTSLDPLSNVLLGWHFHFLPTPASEDSPRSAEPEPPRLLVRNASDSLPDQLAEAAGSTQAVDAIFIASQPLLAVSAEREERCEHFFAGFAPRLSLPMRLGVARC